MVIYIHGFGSSGFGDKAKLFRDYFKKRGIPFIAPSLSHIPYLAVETLKELIESYEQTSLIGSSLGGYYTLYLSQLLNLKAVLINPAIKPYETLNLAIPEAINYYDLSSFEWNTKHINELKKYKIDHIKEEHIMLLLQKGDELLDYNEAIDKLPHSKIILENGGNHGFKNIERYFDKIEKFLI